MSDPILSSDDLIRCAIRIAADGRRKRVAVAAAQDIDVIGAVSQAHADGFLDGTLVGDAEKIRSLAESENVDTSELQIVDLPDVAAAAHHAVDLASRGEADIVMKGFLPTSALLKTVLNRKYNLRGSGTVSHCAVLDVPGRHKMLSFTDGGMVVQPTREQKFDILANAVLVAKAMGLSPVKVAVSGVAPQASDRIPHTIDDRDYLAPRVKAELTDVELAVSMSVDIAMSPDAARAYGVDGPVAGDADIFLVDSIEECNITCKGLINFVGAVFCGVVVGAKVPVSLVSRTDTIKNKKSSLALACVLSDYYVENNIWGEGE